MLRLMGVLAAGTIAGWATGRWAGRLVRHLGGGNRSGVSEPRTPSLAATASRANPLLVLHAGHAMRCWPTAAGSVPGLPCAHPRLDWTIEIDGMVEHVGPPSDGNSTSREVARGIREWWDAVQAPGTAVLVAAPRGEG